MKAHHSPCVRWLAAAAVALVVVLGSTAGLTTIAAAAQPVDEVHYTFTGKTSVAIDWRGDANDVRWGPTTAYGSTDTGVPPQWTPWSSPGPFWQLQLTGLTPGATYHYSIGGGPDLTFHTPPTSSFRFDAIGDVGDTTSFSKLGSTLSSIAGDDPSFVLMVGDLTYANATGASMSVVDQHFNDMMNSWASSAAYMPAWGNHEYDVAGSDDLRNYKGRLLMPNAQTSPGSPTISAGGNDWGWFDAGPVRFIAYPEPWTGAWADWQSKANTLMAQAQNDPSIKYIITYGHRPAYSTGYHPGEALLASILDGFGSSYSKYVLNINGHSHDYERFQPIQGVTHVTVGAPSSVEAPYSGTDARTAFRALHLSHLRVDVSDTGLRMQAVCDASVSKEDFTCSQGSVIDEYTIGTPPSTPPKTEYYVDKTVAGCSDTGPGTASTPFCTIVKGVSRLQPGYTLYIGDGTYAETVKPLVSGAAGNPVTITAWPGRSPTIGTGATYGAYLSTRSYVTISNLTFGGSVADGIYVTKSDHITLNGNKVTAAGKPVQGGTAPGISLRSTNDSTVTGNTSSHNNGHGIYVSGTSTQNTISANEANFNAEGWQRNANGIDVISPGNSVLRNVTHDNEDSGIQFYTGGDNGLAALNVTYNNGDHGIDNLNVTGGRIISNTVYRNCTSGINVEGTSTNYTVVNNIAVDNAVYPAYNGISCARRTGNIGIWDSAPPTTVVDHNLVHLSKAGTMYVFKSAYSTLAAMQAATGQESHGVQSDPKFLDPASGDLQLGGGSPAIDRGDSAISGAQDHDILGAARVRDPNADNSYATGPRLYDDLGAFEYQPDVVTPPAGPTAKLSVSPASGTAPVQVTADASGSTDPQDSPLSYTFDFGDGSSPVTQGDATASHTYTAAGDYTVQVTATDASGLTDKATQTVTVTAAPLSPIASLTATPSTGTAPLSVSADGSGSTDPGGQELSYTFDWGDGTSTGPQTTATASHTYSDAGTYSLQLTVKNASGLTDTTTQLVTVKVADVAPTASLSLSPPSGDAPVQVTADASGSTDPQGQSLTYAFDWGDGTTTGSQGAATATHTYTTAGTYDVKLTVTDTAGLSDSTTKTVSVTTAPTPPAAILSLAPSTGTAPLPVTADASGSTDPQGQSLTYAFDWGDGTTTGSQGAATATHTYTTAGTYDVKLTVTDTAGLSDSTTKTVSVTTAPGYVGRIGTTSSTTSTKTAVLTLDTAVKTADMIVLTARVDVGANKPVTATDPLGNIYSVGVSRSDSTGAKVSVLYGVATKPMPAGTRITLSFATATAHRVVADELTGVSTLDRTASATGSTATFSSGATKSTTSPREVVFGVVGLTGTSQAPIWASAWTPAPPQAVGNTVVSTGFRILNTTGTVTASGSATGTWTAAALTFRP